MSDYSMRLCCARGNTIMRVVLCWKYHFRDPNFKIFPGGMPPPIPLRAQAVPSALESVYIIIYTHPQTKSICTPLTQCRVKMMQTQLCRCCRCYVCLNVKVVSTINSSSNSKFFFFHLLLCPHEYLTCKRLTIRKTIQ